MRNRLSLPLLFVGRTSRAICLLFLASAYGTSLYAMGGTVAGKLSALGPHNALGRPALLAGAKHGILAQSAQTITVTATDPDGTNTGTARLGVPVNLTAVVSPGTYTAVSWKVLGYGTVTASGTNNTTAVYNPPSSMPASANETVEAYLTSQTSVKTLYAVTLVNAVPTITSVSSGYPTAGTTTSFNLHGTGFVSGTVVSSSVGSVTTTYTSSTELAAQVTLSSSQTGNISFTAQNPTPGGGTGTAYQTTIQSIQMTATAPNGTNTGTAWMGAPVTFTTAVSNSVYSQEAWSMTGPGTLTSGGTNNGAATYTPPTTLPAAPNNVVTVTADMTGDTAMAVSYTMTLTNPIPTVSSVSPTQLATGGTDQITLTGAGLIPGTTVTFNGNTLPTTNLSYNSSTVQVPVPANASGTLSFSVQNAGVKTGASFTESVGTKSIALTASDQDGTNTGTAELGINVTMSATVTGSDQTAITWSVSGAGSISSNGVYTAPAAMPSNTSVTITGALTSNPTVTASYALSIINPIPAITGASPAVITAGTPTAVTLSGSGFVPGTVIAVGGTAVTATYQSSTAIIAQVTAAAGSTANLSVTAQNPSPGGGTSGAFAESVAALPTITSVSAGYITAGATTSVNIHGTGFVAGTVVQSSVGSLTTSYMSSTELSAQVTMPASVTGSISLTPQNPAPGGGAGPVFQTTVQSIQLIATAPSGTNSGLAWIGAPVTFSATVLNSVYSQVAWTLTGPGSLSTGGSANASATYTPPSTLPTSATTVSVTAYLNSYAALTTTYTMSLTNPNPTVSSVSPTQLATGGTDQITMSGAGFIPGTTVTFNGTTLATNYLNYNSATVQVPVAANASGSLSFAVQNPGAAAGSSFTESVAGNSIVLTATDQDGTNTGTAELGINVTMTAAVSGSAQTAVTWSLTGAGSISSSGVYTAPSTLPSSTAVTITATLTSNPSVTASYSLSLINPTPAITGASPAVVTAGAPTAVTLTGIGFVPGTVIAVNGMAVATTYQSSTSIVAQMTAAAGSTANLSVTAQNPAPGGGTGASFAETVAALPTITSVSAGYLTAGATTSVNVHGTGFVAGTVIQTSIGSLTTTYMSSTELSAQVTIPASATGNISFTAQNPAPGGGTGPAFQTTMQSIQITSTAPTGANSSVAWIGAPVIFSAAVQNSVYSQVAWTLTGPGTLTTGGTNNATATYTPPSTLPSSGNSFTVSASLNSYSALTTSDTLTLANPVVTVSSATPAQLLTGGTQTVTLTGTGFIPGTTVAFNGSSLATTNLSYTSATVQVPVATNATGTLSLTAQNPGVSGGGVFAESITPNTITLTAVDQDGTNTGTAELGINVTVSAAVAGSQQTAVTWSVTGAGTISTNGVYTAPAALPSSNSVTITAALTSNPSVTASYALSLLNPVPAITAASPTVVTAGAPTAVTVTGTGFVPGTVVLVNGTAIATTYQSGTTLVAQITAPAGTTANLSLTAQSPSPGGGTSPSLAETVAALPAITSVTSGYLTSGATTSVNLHGTGFTAGTVVQSSVGSLTTTYMSSTELSASVTIPASATGNISFTPQNPAPGGGAGVAFQTTIQSIQLNATAPNGANTGTAWIGAPVNFTATVVNSIYSQVAWTLTGPGALAIGGPNNASATYTPPATLPTSGTVVTVTAYTSGYTAMTTTYTMTLANPALTISSVNPTQLLTGGTQQVTLTGAGFITGTTVSFNGSSLTTTNLSYNSATVQVPVAANATGTLNLTAVNPGVAVGAAFSESVQPNSIALTAVDPDGTNTGTAELGINVTVTAAVTGSAQTGVTWSLSGAGSISTSGVYTAPAALPSSTAVTITAVLTSNPAITALYSLSIINPTPIITAASPALAPAGETTTVTLTGTGFVPNTVILVNGSAVPTTYQSATSITAQITVAANATGNMAVSGENPTPGGGTGPTFPVAVASAFSPTAAARLLDQTTFGPTTALIQQVQQEGVTAWLAQQFNTPAFVYNQLPNTPPSYCTDEANCTQSEWWQAVLTGNDQLRQRVAFALSEMFVVSSDTVLSQGTNYYINMLSTDAFSNWSQIMNDVTLSPAMGIYLNMVNSAKPTATEIANENFARENMQLFNLGLFLINQDGSPQLDGYGNPIPTYTEAQVEAFARVYTGWTYAPSNGIAPTAFTYSQNYYSPMAAVESQHDENPKTLLNGTTLPAGQTAEQDLAGALANIFQHPNLPPFICQQLIQHLVKSNPSPAYISRVAAVFINDGNNVRGDMQAVLEAIFTDPEARAGDTTVVANDGHLREPVLWTAAVMRGLGYVNTDSNNYYGWLSNYDKPLGEVPFAAADVFNFFPPSYVIPGTSLSAPEFAIENTATVAGRLSMADTIVHNYMTHFNVDLSATSPLGTILTNSGPTALVNALSSLYLYDEMDSNTAQAIVSEISTVTSVPQQLRLAVYLVITSPEYLILH